MSQDADPTMNLAQLNIAAIREPLDSPRMAPFVEQLEAVNAAGEAAPGFVWRLKDDGAGATSYRVLGDDRLIVNLTVWRDLESLRSFVIGHAGHRAALVRRHDWFERPTEPMTVCWHVPVGHEPTVAEAETMLLRLRAEGPSRDVFPFTYRG
jgi:hypothetical protein